MFKFLPNLMTITHLSFGIYSIILSFEGEYKKACLFIMLAMLLDGLDGRVARLLNVSGDFGKELDSLADVVSFGVAPSLILYNVAFNQLDILGLLLTFLFPICGVLRLARFNTSGFKLSNYFVGLPITAAGGILSVIASYYTNYDYFILITVNLILSFLMISNIKFPNFKKVKLPKNILIVVPVMSLSGFFVIKYVDYSIDILLTSILVLLGLSVVLKIKSRISKNLGIKDDEDFDFEDYDSIDDEKKEK